MRIRRELFGASKVGHGRRSAMAIATALAVAALIPVTATAAEPTEPPAPDDVSRGIVEEFPEIAPGVQLAGLNPVTPYRLLDTRDGTGVPAPSPVSGGQWIDVTVVGLGGVPASGVDAVVLNVTVTGATTGSFLTVWPTGATRPEASSLNMAPGQTVPNLVLAKVGAGGKVSIFNGFGSTDVIADVVGWSAPGPFLTALNPTRLLDTRIGKGAPQAPVGPNGVVELTVAGLGGVPASGVDAVVLNVTVTESTAPSYVTVWPTGQTQPKASSLNSGPGQTNPNLVVSKLGAGGKVSLFNANGSTALIADVVGWLPIGGAYTAINPTRVLDTRSGDGTYGTFIDDPLFGPILRPKQIDFEQRFRPRETVQLDVQRPLDLPWSATAVVLNLTGTQATQPTFVTAWAYGKERPTASSLNLSVGDTRPNLVVVEIGDGGYVSLYNEHGYVHLLADVVGYFEARNVEDDVDPGGSEVIHVVHAIPSDASATYGDPEIRKVLDVAEEWVEDKGGRGFRFDRSGGAIEITTVHLEQTSDEIADSADTWNTDWVDAMLSAGLSVDGKSYLSFIEGAETGWLCGLGGGQHAQVFTEGCDFAGAGAHPSLTATWERSMAARTAVHELFHVFGAVARCTPNSDGSSGHVYDDTDIMNSTDMVQSNGELEPGTRNAIDPGNDDYWGQGNRTCPDGEDWPDISLSVYLDAPD